MKKLSENLNYASSNSSTKNPSGKRLDAYTRGPIGPAMARMAMHMAIGHLTMSVFNITDTFFVSKLGTIPLAAMSFTFPIVFLAFTLMFGIGIGTASVASRIAGSGDHDGLKRLATDSLMLTLCVGCIVTALGLTFMHPLLKLMGAEGETLRLASQYLQLWFWAFPLASLPMVGNNAIRAAGDTKTPAMIMSISALLNLAIDPIFIFGLGPIPAMGITGAATATIISRYISVIAAMWILSRRLKLISLEWPGISKVLLSWRRLMHTAIPASMTFTFLPISMYILTRIISTFGYPAVAAMGAATRFEGLTLIPVMSMASVLLPFTGQNYGQGNFDRIKHALKLSRRFIWAWGCFAMILMYFCAEPVSHLFSSDPEVLKHLKWGIVILSLSHGGVGLGMSAGSGLNAISLPIHAASVTMIRAVLLAVPLALLGATLYGPLGVFGGLAASRIISGLASDRWMRHMVNKKHRDAPEAETLIESDDETDTEPELEELSA